MNKHKRTRIFLATMLAISIIAMAFIGCDASLTSASPEVKSTFPTNVSTGAAINGTISATFHEPVDSASINTTTFTVSSGGSDIAGIVTYDMPNRKAIFAPSANLGNSTVYTATLTTGVKNLDDVMMSQANVWSFTTAAAGVGPSPVNLRTAGNYAILAKTGVSTIPNSVITGDVGLSPAATSFATGFSETAATGYATSAQITGNLYAANMADPTPINLTTAVSDMHTAYTDAAGRITPDYLDFYSGAIGSRTLAPGLYTWTSSVSAASNVTIEGGANDTWIFQITGDMTVSTGVSIILSGGAQAKNIVWQVAGTVDLQANSVTKGIILGETSITLGTGATINGRLLAQTAVNLDQAIVTNPSM
jgi:hypothetical protein